MLLGVRVGQQTGDQHGMVKGVTSDSMVKGATSAQFFCSLHYLSAGGCKVLTGWQSSQACATLVIINSCTYMS